MKGIFKNYRYYFKFFLIILLFTFLSGCGGVTPTGPTISSFTASSTTINEGDSVTLSWVTNATTVSIDQGIDSVTAPSGSTIVTPASTTTYTLTATNSAGSSTATVTITVGQDTPPTYSDIDIQSSPAGAKVYIDGVDTGNITPYVKTHIETGAHTIKLELFHYKTKEETNVMVYTNETTYLNWALIIVPEQTITLQPGGEGKDAYVVDSQPTLNYDPENLIYVGGIISPSTIFRSYLQFDLSSLPSDTVILDANLGLQYYYYDSVGIVPLLDVGLYQVKAPWVEDTITWDSQPNSSNQAEDIITIPYPTTSVFIYWNIFDLVNGWHNESITNYGMLLRLVDESLNYSTMGFLSSDYSIVVDRPKLEIKCYIP
jgi:hypothetical protein